MVLGEVNLECRRLLFNKNDAKIRKMSRNYHSSGVCWGKQWREVSIYGSSASMR